MKRQPAYPLMILSLLLWTSWGCSTLKAPKFPWQKDEKIEYRVPQKMVVTWKDTVRFHPGEPPTRGFGGRVHFYDERNNPCRVQGEFVVYGFVDTPAFQNNRDKPDRKYVFEADTLESHHSMSKIGDSYSFWIPWDNPGGPQLEITLAPFFRNNGHMIVGDQSRQVLPGKAVEKSGPNLDQRNLEPQYYPPSPSDRHPPGYEQIPTPEMSQYSNILPAGYYDETSHADQNYGMQTTTIPLNETMAKRLRDGQPQPGAQGVQTQFQPHTVYRGQQIAPHAIHPPLNQQVPQVSGQAAAANLRGPSPTPGGMPQEFYVTPGINLQSYKPSFSNSSEYSQYLSNGHAMARPPHGPAVGYSPDQSQVPSTQTARPSGAGPRSQPSPSLWPPGLPPQHSPQGSTAGQPAAGATYPPPGN